MVRWTRLRKELPLLLPAYGLVWLIRCALWLMPFRTLRSMVGGVRVRPARDASPTPMHLAWIVVVTSRYVPKASCLTQALVTDILLRRHGYLGVLHIGVAMNEHKRLAAHAWLEYDGSIIIGGRGHLDYQPFPRGKI